MRTSTTEGPSPAFCRSGCTPCTPTCTLRGTLALAVTPTWVLTMLPLLALALPPLLALGMLHPWPWECHASARAPRAGGNAQEELPNRALHDTSLPCPAWWARTAGSERLAGRRRAQSWRGRPPEARLSHAGS